VKGDDVLDTVCIFKKDGLCAKSFKFLAVSKMDPSMLDIDGGIGLAPDDLANGPSFIATLQDQTIISEKKFGLIIGPKNQSDIKSTITIGGYDETMFKDESKVINWYPIVNQARWEIALQDLKMGNKSIYTSSKKRGAVLDSFFPYIAISPSDFVAF